MVSFGFLGWARHFHIRFRSFQFRVFEHLCFLLSASGKLLTGCVYISK